MINAHFSAEYDAFSLASSSTFLDEHLSIYVLYVYMYFY